MERRRNARAWETGYPRGHPFDQRHRPARFPGAKIRGTNPPPPPATTPPGIEPGSPGWEVGTLTARPPRSHRQENINTIFDPWMIRWPDATLCSRRRLHISATTAHGTSCVVQSPRLAAGAGRPPLRGPVLAAHKYSRRVYLLTMLLFSRRLAVRGLALNTVVCRLCVGRAPSKR
ncbi:hypothetical protein PR048_032429 [Dryococelus australis]|uniref:Uncharacterized protein n=1 Tax=Dryococelus australis TaxID=614101 RepID=A0ABQ9G270_9NEOP|nr:hypothetical protein PR048_032429 [Dryococelus australis]